ncbi:MAG TPA: aldehyde dehydrogenase family protein [Steroidobacteraceae bacterium]|nr:aldehyde dehydrogenase family protein [Steroidobacteraceae bacterium]
MVDSKLFYINGKWAPPAIPKLLDIENPATEQVIAQISLGSQADVDSAVAAARAAFASFSETTREQRVALLERIVAEYNRRAPDLARAVTAEMGAPTWLARDAQVPLGATHFTQAIEALKKYEFERQFGTSLVRREPVGVCALITPWNWPLYQIGCKVAAALAAGCTMVLKPSEIAPLNAIIFAEVLDAAGVPPGVFNLINGDGPTVGAALSSHKDVDMVSFTGSTRAGIDVARNAAATVKKVAQELGGKSANILLDDADLATFVPSGVQACFMNSGQACAAPTRMLVPRHLHDEVVRLAKASAEATTVGDPQKDGVKVGPLVSKAQFERVQGYIRKGIEEGATLLAGGIGMPEGLTIGHFAKPTIFSNVRADMVIAQEEIFGPVLVIIPYKDEDDAVRIANDSQYGLSGFVVSKDLERARKVAKRLRTGQVRLNGAKHDFSAPFGGYKYSGNGREFGVFGIEEFLEAKSICGYFPM